MKKAKKLPKLRRWCEIVINMLMMVLYKQIHRKGQILDFSLFSPLAELSLNPYGSP